LCIERYDTENQGGDIVRRILREFPLVYYILGTFANLFVASHLLFPIPILEGLLPNSRPLYNQNQIQALYNQVSPAVVEIRAGESRGSGFIIDRQGYIITNNHVLGEENLAEIKFADGTTTLAIVLTHDPDHDLALLKVPSKDVAHTKPLKLADSAQVRPGDMVIAIGNPYRLNQSISVGVINGIDRELLNAKGEPTVQALQTNAPIYPCNSGGPLINEAGQVIGFTTAIVDFPKWVMDAPNIGFAIPSKYIEETFLVLKVANSE
jgi:S1-C subfamily serine protease